MPETITTLSEFERSMEYAKAYHDSKSSGGGGGGGSTPTGAVYLFSGEDIPNGWLLCNGAEIGRDDYANLFDAIGTTWGDGDGETTFNLPDFRDAFAEGAGSYATGEEISAGAPALTGRFDVATLYSYTVGSSDQEATEHSAQIVSSASGAVSISSTGGSSMTTGNYWSNGTSSYTRELVSLTASDYNSIYNSSETVQPAALAVYYIIKT